MDLGTRMDYCLLCTPCGFNGPLVMYGRIHRLHVFNTQSQSSFELLVYRQSGSVLQSCSHIFISLERIVSIRASAFSLCYLLIYLRFHVFSSPALHGLRNSRAHFSDSQSEISLQSYYFGFRASASPTMENCSEQEHDPALALPHEDRGSRQYKGIRLRKWGSWVSEIRMPNCREKIWLGSYATPEQAARAYDAAVYCLRGPNAKFNFSVPEIPSASSLSPQQIQNAAFEYALSQTPSSLPSFVGHASPSQSSSMSEMELSGDNNPISEEWPDFAPWWSLFTGSDGAGIPNLEEFPSTGEVPASELIATWPEQQEEDYTWTDLWNFRDV